MADNFDENAILRLSGPVVIILVGMTVKTFNGAMVLSGMSASKYYLNMDIPEAQAFKDRCDPISIQLIEHICTNPVMTEQEEINNNRVSIIDLLQHPTSRKEDVVFSCEATIVDIDLFEGWYYDSCPHCRTVIHAYNEKLWCNKCCEVIPTSVPMYKINIVVKDPSAHADFIMFGRTATDLIGISAQAFAGNSKYDRFSTPPIVQALIGMTRIFRVISSEQQYDRVLKFRVIRSLHVPSEDPITPLAVTAESSNTSRGSSSQLPKDLMEFD